MSNPAATFEPYRRRLLGLAYRMLGSMADAEDAMQETYLRRHGADRDKVSNPRALLMTTATRICLDMLTSARVRREENVGPWLPEPVLDTAALAPDSRTELAEDLSTALLLTLDRLSPLERAAFLLHDVFDFSFSEVATALERSEAACRQLECGDGVVKGRDVADVRPQSSAPHPLDDLTQLGTIGLDNEVDRQAEVEHRLTVRGASSADDVGAGLSCELRHHRPDCAGRAVHEDALPRLKAAVLEQSLPRGQARDRQARAHREVDVARQRREVDVVMVWSRVAVASI